ncbi:JmjC domain, hydroxylase-domain-containing protein [Papiliotrema laurentii]|nr:JmjC domain, hydroxylase-domain-containing protein [Papiliotrema laurentii]KAK1920715.1 JmjC domain, hydroxylase-domain-containing protein [Papiliotrema laurentii]
MYTAEDSSTSNAEEPAFPPVAWDDWVAEDVYPAESFKSLSPEDRQRIESQVLLQQAARTASRYATSLNGSVFPPTLQDPGVRWHMNYLSNPLQALQRCEGINTSFIYLGSYGSSFEWHAEDLLSYSMNWVQWGADKLWYVVAPGDLEAWEAEVRNDLVSSYTAKKYKNTCHNFLRHKDLSIHKGVIESMGYKTNAVFQHAGEMIITFPRGVHSGFNLGTNLAEAQNFCTPDWLEETFPSCKRAYQCPEACALDLYSLDLEPLELLRERLRLGESWEQICGGMVMQETTNARAMWQ